MNLQKAKKLAQYSANNTNLTHVIAFDGVKYSIHLEKRFTGNVIEAVYPEKETTSTEEVKENIEQIYNSEQQPEEVKHKKANVSKKA